VGIFNIMLISLVFQAVNKASSEIVKIGQDVARLGAVSSVLSAPGMKQGFAVFADGFSLASLAATKAMQTIEQQIGKAQSLQQQFVGNAASLSAQTARSFDESYGVIAEISNKITEISAPLPGETQKYKDIGNILQASLIRGYVDKKGNVDFAGFGQAVTGLSTNYGALALGKGMGSQNATLFLQRALNGSSFAELNQLEFGEKSPEVINAIKNELKKMGYTELKSIQGLAKRASLLERATKPFISDEFIEKSSSTIEGITESFNTKVFDQRVGIFGMFREINDKGTGIKNAIEAYTKFLGAVIGDKGIFAKLGEFAKTIGIAIDPMQIAHDMFLLFTEGVLILGNGIEAATNSFKKNRNIFSAVGAFFDTVANQIAEDLGVSNFHIKLPEQLDGVFSFLGDGISQAQIIAGKGVDFVLPILQSGFANVSDFFADLFNKFNSGEIEVPDFSKIGDIYNNLNINNIKSPDFSGIADINQAIPPFVNRIISWTGNQFSGVTLPEIQNAGQSAGQGAGDLFVKFSDGASKFVKSTFDTINGINWGEISTMIGNGILAGITYFREFTMSSIPGIVDGLVKITGEIINGLGTAISNIKDSIFADGNFADLNTKVAIGSYQLGESIGAWLGSGISYLANLNWGGILVGIGNTAIILGGLFIVAVNAVCSVIGGMLVGFEKEVKRGLQKPISSFISEFNAGFTGIFQSVSEMATSVWDTITKWTQSTITRIKNEITYGIKGSLDSLSQAWNDITSYIVNLLKKTVSATKNTIGSIFSGVMNKINNINIPVVNKTPAEILQKTGQILQKTPPAQAIKAVKENVLIPVWESPVIKKITGRYMGNIPEGYVPNAANGLMSAINEERLNMPLGANIVVANNKEFILAPTNKKFSGSPTQSNELKNTPRIGDFAVNINNLILNSQAVNRVAERRGADASKNFSTVSKFPTNQQINKKVIDTSMNGLDLTKEMMNIPMGANIAAASNRDFVIQSTQKTPDSIKTPSNNAPKIGNITININGVGRNAVNIAEEVADLVIGMLEGRIESEYSANIS
jgi:hypothetical protein